MDDKKQSWPIIEAMVRVLGEGSGLNDDALNAFSLLDVELDEAAMSIEVVLRGFLELPGDMQKRMVSLGLLASLRDLQDRYNRVGGTK